MKTIHTLEEVTDLGLTIFAINSHTKPYSLCWHINKILGFDLKKNKGAFVSDFSMSTVHEESSCALVSVIKMKLGIA